MRKLTRQEALRNLNLPEDHAITRNSDLKTAYNNYIRGNNQADKTIPVRSVAALLPKKPTTIQEILQSFMDVFFEHESVSKETINAKIATSPSELANANTDAKINLNCMTGKFYNFAKEALPIPQHDSLYAYWQVQYCLLLELQLHVDLTHFYKNHIRTTDPSNNHWDIFYQFIYKKIDWVNLTGEQGVTCLEFLHSEDGKKLCEIFELIHTQIEQNILAEKELTALKDELIDKIADTLNPPKVKTEIQNNATTDTQTPFSRNTLKTALHGIVENKIEEKTNILTMVCDGILDLLRKIAGIFLAVCGVGVPLCYPPFHSYFFESRPSVPLELLSKINTSLSYKT